MNTNPSAGDTVIPTKTSSTTTGVASPGESRRHLARAESNPAARKRQLEPHSAKTEVPMKAPRHGEHTQTGPRDNKRDTHLEITRNANLQRIQAGIHPAVADAGSHVEMDAKRTSKKASSAPMEPGREVSRSKSQKTSDKIPQGKLQTPDDPSINPTMSIEKIDSITNNEVPSSTIRTDDKIHTESQQNGAPKSLKRSSEDTPCNAKISRKYDEEGVRTSDSPTNYLPAVSQESSTNDTRKMPNKLSGESIEVTKDSINKGHKVVENPHHDVEGVKMMKKPPIPPEGPHQRVLATGRKDDTARLRKTIQWLEEGARRMREDLATTRAELHEERRAARLARREFDTAVREARITEAAKHQQIVSELKTRLSQSPSRPAVESTSTSAKSDFLREENHRRELSALRKRLAEAEATMQKLKSNSRNPHGSGKRRRIDDTDTRRLEVEVHALRAANKKLEEKLIIAIEAERSRAAELRTQHENQEAQLAALQKALRSDTIKMMDEIRGKTREIEKLEKLVQEGSQMHRKLQTKEDGLMRKLRESEKNHQIRLAPRIEEKIPHDDHVVDLCQGDCNANAEVERLRELAVEQQEVIEVLRQAVKEKERKLDQLSNKKRKEEFYKQWLELEPVVEVDDEEEQEEGDSALSSAPSSLSPQPGGCAQWPSGGVTKEAYETVLLEVEELQTRLIEEQQELTHAKSQVRELEKALLQETRGSQNSRRALSDKLRDTEDREATLVAEISELREQNELLEFRVLELEESPGLRDTPDPADSGIVSPEPIHLYKDQLNKQRDRAVATVIPYNTYAHSVSPIPQKPPLSLQESGIFDEEDDIEIELASRGTQTEAPAGELLQEVQRLHELRARIQERAVKVPVPIIDTKYASPEIGYAADITQVASYQERIRELEERLGAYEEAEEKCIQDKQISKQREEDLLDENYKLTERIYWFENVLRNSKEAMDDEDSNTQLMTEKGAPTESSCREENSKTEDDKPPMERVDSETEEVKELGTLSHCTPHPKFQKFLHEMMLNYDEFLKQKDIRPRLEMFKLEVTDIQKALEIKKPTNDPNGTNKECEDCGKFWMECNDRLQDLAKAELCLRQRIADLEREECVFKKTLQQVSEAWSHKETDYTSRLKHMQDELEVKVSANLKFADRLRELEEKLEKYQQQFVVCQGVFQKTKQDLKHCADQDIDEVDNFYSANNIECDKKAIETITSCMSMDYKKDVVVVDQMNVEEQADVQDKIFVVPKKDDVKAESMDIDNVDIMKGEVNKAEKTNCEKEKEKEPEIHLEGRSIKDSIDRKQFVETVEIIVAGNNTENVSERDKTILKEGTTLGTSPSILSEITINVPGTVAAEITPEVATEAKEELEPSAQGTSGDIEEAGAQAQGIPDEAQAEPAEEAEAVVTITESEPEKKDKQLALLGKSK